MEKRRFGRTGHLSTVAIFGGFALSQATTAEADAVMEQVIAAGVNHIDIAPSYGIAEERLGPWMRKARDRFFLGCKTMERTREGARAEMQRSLARLQVAAFDLYQIHAITSRAELDQATAPGGALEAIVAAREQGLTRFIGITGHGWQAPDLFLEALNRFDFDSLLFPINFVMFANPAYRRSVEALLDICQAKDVGTMIIKAVACRPWGGRRPTHITWYEPFGTREMIQAGVNFVLSQPVTGLCTAGDPQVLPQVLAACENYQPLSPQAQAALIDKAGEYEPIFH